MTYESSRGPKFAPEKQVPWLNLVIRNDILKYWITNIAHGKNHGRSFCYVAEIMGKTKYWPIVGDSTEIRILSVEEMSIVDELCSNIYITPTLEGHSRILKGKINVDGDK